MNNKALRAIIGFIIALILVVTIYFIYVFASYYRIDDNYTLDVNGNSKFDTISTEEIHRISSANLGFGAYSSDYSFFMDGGTESWAYSEDAVYTNIKGSIDNIYTLNADIMLFQEIDLNSTRSYHVNQQQLIFDEFDSLGRDSFTYSFAQNYDSPFLFYPLTQPHGKSVAGVMTASNYAIQNAIRRSLPIEEGFSKLIDLDRCYSKNYINVDNGKQLVVYNVHLSAYTTDPSTAENQVIMLNGDMLDEIEKGNYVIAGGDMNKDLLGDSTQIFGSAGIADNWAAPFPVELLDSSFSVVGPLDLENPVPSCRNADEPYNPGHTFVLTIDGFIVSSNVEVVDSKVFDSSFAYSDHNPVYMDFILH